MAERLAAPAAARGCLDLEALHAAPDEPGALCEMLQSALQGADQLLAERFWAGEPVDELVRARAWVVEQLLLRAFDAVIGDALPLALIAVGGFGRGELHPHSDVDLLILLPDGSPDDDGTAAIEAFVTLLWDAGFYLGHSVRTLEDCQREARDDVATATNLMEARLLAGDPAAFDDLQERVGPAAMWPAPEFFSAKFDEQLERHAQFHDTAYNLEPNIKEGPGGLRDIQMVGWVARRHFGAQTLHGLVDHGFLTEHEHEQLLAGQQFLWRVRFALHLLAGRAEDRLLFDLQSQVARRFGYEDQHESNLAVEQFMQDYYRTVMQLERLNERLLQLFREELLVTEERVEPLDDDFQVRNGYLEVIDETLFLRRPLAIMDVFLHMARNEHIRGVRAATIRSIRHHLYLVDENYRTDPEVLGAFVELLRQRRGIYSQLQRMNRYGVLAALIPPFQQVVGRMQFDLFHVYTVDQHSLFVVRNLRRFAYGKYRDQFPHAASVFGRIDRPEVLYLAALFHDIAKGRGGDHSELGADDAARFCARLPIDPADRDLVSWLVRHHLMMSQTAQRRDLADPQTIAEFAQAVGDRDHLDHLYLLTMADIAATSPKLWNAWKGGLLWELYTATAEALARGMESPLDRERRVQDTRRRAIERLSRDGWQADDTETLWAQLPAHAGLRLTTEQLAWTSSEALAARRDGADVVRVAVRPVPSRGVTEVFVHAPDYDGLFATVVAVLDEMGLDVLSARVLTTDDGYSYDLFQLMDHHGRPLNATDTAALIGRLTPLLTEREVSEPVRRRTPRRLRPFMAPPDIRFGEASSGATLLEVECTDRPGLLSQVAAALHHADVRVHDARIATFGDHVEDVFELTGRDGRALDESTRERLERALREQLSGEA